MLIYTNRRVGQPIIPKLIYMDELITEEEEEMHSWEEQGWFLLLVLLVGILFIKKIARDDRMEKTKKKMPPGRRGWPLVGDSFNWYAAVASSHPPTFVQKQVKRYGRIFSCSLFGKWAVVSADPTFNKFIMQNEGKLFQSSYPKSFKDLVGINGIITAQGHHQRKLHRIASSMMRLDKLKLHFINHIQLVMLQTLTHFQHNQIISLQDVCRKVAINTMVNHLLGVTSDAEVNEFTQLLSDFVDGCLSVPINLPGFAYHTAMKARESIIGKINKIIEKHRHEEGGGGKSSNSVVERLVDEEESLADEDVADFIINLLFAGNETTAKTMVFAVYYLTHCPRAMKQLVEEHHSIKHNNNDSGMVTWSDYKEMRFTQQVIDETLRLGGIAIWLMREAKEEVEYKEYVIPKGCFVVPFLSAVHLDETYYEGPLMFDPWRWDDAVGGLTYSPFGGGPRLCPGAELARLQIALFLHYFVTSYTWTQMKEDRMSFFPSARLVNGFQICLHKL